jgi:hypothetical protein
MLFWMYCENLKNKTPVYPDLLHFKRNVALSDLNIFKYPPALELSRNLNAPSAMKG